MINDEKLEAINERQIEVFEELKEAVNGNFYDYDEIISACDNFINDMRALCDEELKILNEEV